MKESGVYYRLHYSRDSRILSSRRKAKGKTPDFFRLFVLPPDFLQIALARGPPDWLEADLDQTTANDSEAAEPIPEFEFAQTVCW